MTKLGKIVRKIRSKNAGPFWLTVDIFCNDSDNFNKVSAGLKTDDLANVFQTPPSHLKRYDLANLQVIKFSLPRPQIQGTAADTDMHGASFAALLEDLELSEK